MPRERCLGEREQSRKALKTGVVGVCLIAETRHRTRTTQYLLAVTCPGQKSRRLYVGTESTWQGRFDAKLREAKAIRERYVERRAAEKAVARRCARLVAAEAGTAPR